MKKVILGIMIGIILCGGIVYAASVYYAKDISYTPSDETWNVSNVNEAINDLYGMKNELDNIKGLGDAAASDIAKGKTAVVKGKLITGIMNGNLEGIQLTKYKTAINNSTNIVADEDGLYLITAGGFLNIKNVTMEAVTSDGTISGVNASVHTGSALVEAKAGDIITTTNSYTGCIVYKVTISN